jgi:hypothetical protein
MNSDRRNAGLLKVFYVEGSGLFPVPSERANEIGCLKEDYHRGELDKARLAASLRRV